MSHSKSHEEMEIIRRNISIIRSFLATFRQHNQPCCQLYGCKTKNIKPKERTGSGNNWKENIEKHSQTYPRRGWIMKNKNEHARNDREHRHC